MLASLNFVERFVSLPSLLQATTVNGVTFDRRVYDVATISPLLTRQGFEVESVVHFGAEFDGVIVGRIEKAEPHPNAEKLQVCQVNIGGSRVVQIVCGAKNARAGLFVAAATPGTKLPGDKDIKVSSIRDVVSNGMLCSRAELGLPVKPETDGDGIWELHVDSQGGLSEAELCSRLGWPVFDGLNIRDTLLELNVTPNRPDMLCHEGIARELSTGLRFSLEAVESFSHSFVKNTSLTPQKVFSDVVKNSELNCNGRVIKANNELGAPTFFVVLTDVVVGPSPAWLRNQLEALGQASVNNIVDASNYILLAFCQPSHAFDLDKLYNEKNLTEINLRFALDKEVFVGLDGKTRELQTSDCVVADKKSVHALLGILGGEHSKVDSSTKNILIEFANPSSVAVRRTSRRIGRITDASFAFEKGIDTSARWNAAVELVGLLSTLSSNLKYSGALHSQLLSKTRSDIAKNFTSDIEILAACGPFFEQKICVDASVVSDSSFTECNSPDWRKFVVETQKNQHIKFSRNDLTQVLGSEIVEFPLQILILDSLGFNVTGQDVCLVQTPSWRRRDIVGQADLVEEIIRVVGIDSVPSTPIASLGIATRDDVHLGIIESVSNRMTAVGYTEVVGLHFMREDDWSRLNLDSSTALGRPMAVLNPIIQDEPWLHNTLLPDLLRKVRFNVSYGTKRGQLFEVARTFVNLDSTNKVVFNENIVSLNSTDVAVNSSDKRFEYDPSLALSYSTDSGLRPAETPRLAGVCFGNQADKTWYNTATSGYTVHALVGHISEALRPLGLTVVAQPMTIAHPIFPMLHPGRAACLTLQNSQGTTVPLGWVGAIHPKTLRNYEIEIETLGFEINLAVVVKQSLAVTLTSHTRHPRRFPTVVRDFSVLVENKITAENIHAAVRLSLEPLFGQQLPARLTDVTIFDIYRGQGVAEGQKSVAFCVAIDPLERTLTDADIQKIYNSVIQSMQHNCGAILRGN